MITNKIWLGLLALLIISASPYSSAQAKRIDGIAATVNGRVIAQSEVQASIGAQKQLWRTVLRKEPRSVIAKKLKEIESEALTSLINRELILSEFKKLEAQGAGIKDQYIDEDIGRIIREQFDGNEDIFLKELAKTGMSIRKFRELRKEMLVIQFMRQMNTPQIPPVTPGEITTYYNQNISDYRGDPTIKLRTVTLSKYSPSETPESLYKVANDLKVQLKQGANFASIAKSYSLDGVAEKGGDRGWISPGDIAPNISKIAFDMKNGSISDVIDTPTAYLILFIEARKEGDKIPLSQVRDGIEKRIRQQKGKKFQTEWLDRLKEDAMIKQYQ